VNMYEKTFLILITALFVSIKLLAQSDTSRLQNYTNGKSNAAAFGINIPIGEFSKTHIAGISLSYSWSHHRFGNLKALPKKIIGLTANGGADYYFGKKETVAGYNYRYGGYVYLHAFGGAVYNPCKKGSITLTGGPTMGIYKGNADFGFGVNLGGSYYLTNRIIVLPGIIFLKHNKAAALWVGAILAAWTF
jgi:hypothetical protein